MKKIFLSFIHSLAFQLILNKKWVIKEIAIYVLINSCIIANGYAQALDLSYGTEGKILVTSPDDFYFNGNPDRGNESGAMALQKDGKLLIAYNAYRYSENRGFGIVRLNPDGTFDNTFSDDGKAYTEIVRWDSQLNTSDISIAPDGKIIVTGHGFDRRDGINYYAFISSRFNTDGTPDNSFDGDGTLILNESVIPKSSVSVDIQQDCKILLAGYEQNSAGNFQSKIIRLNTNGRLDNNFGIGGIVISPEERSAASAASKIRLQPDGKIVVAGGIQDRSDRNKYNSMIIRLNTNGSFDSDFGVNGKMTVEFGYTSFIYSLAFQTDGKILVAGASDKPDDNQDGDDSDYLIARLNQNGTLDNSFDEDGKKVIDFYMSNDRWSSVAVRSDGLIFMNGQAYGGFGIVCLNSDGSFNKNFDKDGKLVLNFEANELSLGYDILLQKDGKILVSGIAYVPAIARFIFDNSFTLVLESIGNKSINELEEFRFTAKATDKDSSANTLKFSLTNAATGQFPEGATIDKSSGLFCWTPTETQGPGTYRVKIVVSDGECTDEEEIEIKVCEINSKPVLATIGDQTVDENKVLTFTAIAVDKDIPENTLKFSLADPSAGDFPTGASINASTGAFNWQPSKTQVPGTFSVKVIVSDGTSTDEEEFAINVHKTSPASLTAYPNPSAQRATVRFAVPADEAMVTLVVYDFKGQQINRLYEGRAEASKMYSFDLDGSKLTPGVYLVRLSMSQKAETFKLIITD